MFIQSQTCPSKYYIILFQVQYIISLYLYFMLNKGILTSKSTPTRWVTNLIRVLLDIDMSGHPFTLEDANTCLISGNLAYKIRLRVAKITAIPAHNIH